MRSMTNEAYIQTIRSLIFDFALEESGDKTVSQGQSFFAATEGCIV